MGKFMGPPTVSNISVCHPTQAALMVAMHSGCPSSRWLDHASPILLADILEARRPLVLFNVGANKGYNIATFLKRFHNTSFGAHEWGQAMLPFLKETGLLHVPHNTLCGVCHGCDDRSTPRDAAVPVDVHAFELLPANIKWLRWVTKRFGVERTVHVHHEAMSNVSGAMEMSGAGAFGWERGAVDTLLHAPARERGGAATSQSKPEATLAVLVGTLDEYFSWLLSRQASKARADGEGGEGEGGSVPFAGVVDFLSIDAEGYDPLILEGMQHSLSRVRIVPMLRRGTADC